MAEPRIPSGGRTSIRSSTVQKKRELHHKIVQEERKRAIKAWSRSQTSSVTRELTQEERLEEARYTELDNLASLEEIKKMELEKKRTSKKQTRCVFSYGSGCVGPHIPLCF